MGASYDITGQFKDTAFIKKFIYSTKSGTPIDLTGYTAQMVIKPRFDTTLPATLSISTVDYITITPLTGTIDINVPSSVFTIAAGTYAYILYLINGINRITFLYGKLVVSEGMT